MGVSPDNFVIVIINTIHLPHLLHPPPAFLPISAQMQSTMIYNEIFLQNKILVIFPFADSIVIIILAMMPEMEGNCQNCRHLHLCIQRNCYKHKIIIIQPINIPNIVPHGNNDEYCQYVHIHITSFPLVYQPVHVLTMDTSRTDSRFSLQFGLNKRQDKRIKGYWMTFQNEACSRK